MEEKDQVTALKDFYGHYDKANMPDDAKLQDMATRYAGNEKEMWGKLYGHYEKNHKVADEDLTLLAGYKNPYAQGLKKKEETVGSPVAGVVSRTASNATPQANGEVQFVDAPEGLAAPRGVVETPEDDLAKILDRPDEVNLFNYVKKVAPFLIPTSHPNAPVGGLVNAELPPDEIEANAKKIEAGKKVLAEIQKIKASNVSPEEKFIKAKRAVADAASGFRKNASDWAIDDDLAKSETIMESSQPEKYKTILENRFNEYVGGVGLPREHGVREMLKSSIPDVFAEQGDIEEAAMRQDFENRNEQLSRHEKEYADWVSRGIITQKEADETIAKRRSEIESMGFDGKLAEMKDARLQGYQRKIDDLNSIIIQLPKGGDRDAFIKERDLLHKQKDQYLSPVSKVATVMDEYGTEINKAEGSTPLEKMRNYFAELSLEYNDLRQKTVDKGAGNFVVESTWFGSSPMTERMAEINRRRQAIAPIVYFNEGPRGGSGFLDTMVSSYFENLIPEVQQGVLSPTQTKKASTMRTVEALALAGIDASTLNPEIIKGNSEVTSEHHGLGDSRFWANTLGGTASIMTKMAVANKAIPLGQNISKVFGKKKILKYLGEAVQSGVNYSKAGIVSHDDELTFASGFFGGLGAGLIPSPKAIKLADASIRATFGDKAMQAAKVISNNGVRALAAAGGETFEEIGNTLGGILKESSTYDDFTQGLRKAFPDVRSDVEFVVSTMIMGGGMKAAEMASGGESDESAGDQLLREGNLAYENLSPEDKKQADEILNAIANESAEVAENVQQATQEASAAPQADQKKLQAEFDAVTGRIAELVAKRERGEAGGFKELKELQARAAELEKQMEPVTTEEVVAPEADVVEEAVVEAPVSEVSTPVTQERNVELFPETSEFADVIGKSGEQSNIASYREVDGVGVSTYANPTTGVVDVIMAGTSDNDFVGYVRVYENGKPTNRWTSKMENKSGNKPDFKTMITEAQKALPAGHEYTETTSVSTDGIRVYEQQLNRGYEIATDENGNTITNRVAINGDSRVNNLGVDVNPGAFEDISVTTPAQFATVRKALAPLIEKLGLTEKNIHWENGTVTIDLPVLRHKGKTDAKPVSEVSKEAPKLAYDFDGTLYDNKTKQLTPLGEEVKGRLEAGEDVTIVTARDGKDTGEIEAALGISPDKIKATGDESLKGQVLDQLGIDRKDYYDADQGKMDAIQGNAPSVSPDTKSKLEAAMANMDNVSDASIAGLADIDLATDEGIRAVASALIQKPAQGVTTQAAKKEDKKQQQKKAAKKAISKPAEARDISDVAEVIADPDTPVEAKNEAEEAIVQKVEPILSKAQPETKEVVVEERDNTPPKSGDNVVFMRNTYGGKQTETGGKIIKEIAPDDVHPDGAWDVEFEVVEGQKTRMVVPKTGNIRKGTLADTRTDLQRKWAAARAAVSNMSSSGIADDMETATKQLKELVSAFTDLGIELMKTGTTEVKKWTEDMVKLTGEKYRPLIDKIHGMAKARFESEGKKAAEPKAVEPKKPTTQEAKKGAVVPKTGNFGTKVGDMQKDGYVAFNANHHRGQDAFAVNDATGVFVAADGLGSYGYSGSVSEFISDKIASEITDLSDITPDWLTSKMEELLADQAATSKNVKDSNKAKKGEEVGSTTIVATQKISETEFKVFLLGDSPLYRINSDGDIVERFGDDTAGSFGVDGLIGIDKGKVWVEGSPVTATIKLDKGDRIVLGSDYISDGIQTASEGYKASVAKMEQYKAEGGVYVIGNSSYPPSELTPTDKKNHADSFQPWSDNMETRLKQVKKDAKQAEIAESISKEDLEETIEDFSPRSQARFREMHDIAQRRKSLGAMFDKMTPEEFYDATKKVDRAWKDDDATVIVIDNDRMNEVAKQPKAMPSSNQGTGQQPSQKPASEPKGETKEEKKEPKPRVTTDPLSTSGTTRQRGLEQTLLKEGEVFGDFLTDLVKESPNLYEQIDFEEVMEVAKTRIEEEGLAALHGELTKRGNIDPVVSAMQGLAMQMYSKMGSNAVKAGNMELAAKLNEALDEILVSAGADATARGQANGIISQFGFIAPFMDTYLKGRYDKLVAEIMKAKDKNGKTLRERAKGAAKDLNEAKKDNAQSIADEAITDESIKDMKPDANRESIKKKKAEALAEFRKLRGPGLMSGVNPLALIPLTKYGYYAMLDGALTLKDWIKKMKADTGVTDEDLLKGIWDSEFEGRKISKVAEDVAAEKEAGKYLPKEKTTLTEEQKKKAREIAEKVAKAREAIREHLKDPQGSLASKLKEAGLDEATADAVVSKVDEKFEELEDKAIEGAFDYIKSKETRTTESFMPAEKKQRVQDEAKKALADLKKKTKAAIRDHFKKPDGRPLIDKLVELGIDPKQAKLIDDKVAKNEQEISEQAKDGLFDDAISKAPSIAELKAQVAVSFAKTLESEPKGQSPTAKAKAQLRKEIKDAVAKHLKDPDGRPLTSVLIEDVGLTGADAVKIVASVKNATAKRLEAIAGKAAKSVTSKAKKTSVDKMLDKLIDRDMSSDDVAGELFDELGVPAQLTPEMTADLRNKAMAIRETKEGSKVRHAAEWAFAKAASDAIKHMNKKGFLAKAADAWKVFISLIYAGMLNGLPTHAKNFLSVMPSILTLGLSGTLNVAKWARAAKRANDYKGPLSKKEVFFFNSPAYEFFFRWKHGNNSFKQAGLEAIDVIRTGKGEYRWENEIKKNKQAFDQIVESLPVLERTKFRAIPGTGGRAWTNPFNNVFGKLVGRALSTTDALTSLYYENQEVAFALVGAGLDAGMTMKEIDTKMKQFFTKNSPKWQESMDEARADADIAEKFTKEKIPESTIKAEAARLMREKVKEEFSISKERGQALRSVAKDRIFAYKRHGILGQIADILGGIANLGGKDYPMIDVGLKEFFRAIVPFTNIVGNMGDAMLDTLPIYGIARANGWGATAIASRLYNKTFTLPADSKTSFMGKERSFNDDLYVQQLARAVSGNLAVIALMMIAGDDDDDLLSFTGEVPGKPGESYKVKIYGKPKFDYRTFAPELFMPIKFVQSAKEYLKQPQNKGKYGWAMATAALATIWSIKDMSYLDGVSTVIDNASRAVQSAEQAAGDAEKIGKAIGGATKGLFGQHISFYTKPLPTNQAIVKNFEKIISPEQETSGTLKERMWYILGLQSVMGNEVKIDIMGNKVKSYPGNDILPLDSWTGLNDEDKAVNKVVMDQKIKNTWPANEIRTFNEPEPESGSPYTQRTLTPAEYTKVSIRAGELFVEKVTPYLTGDSKGRKYETDKDVVYKQTDAKDMARAKKILDGFRGYAWGAAMKELFGEQTLTQDEFNQLIGQEGL